MINRRNVFVTITTLILSWTAVTPAKAACSSGFIANALCKAGVIDRQTANAVDAAHAAAGRPLDHLAKQAAAAAADYVARGSAGYVRDGLQFRDAYNRRPSSPIGAVRPAAPAVVLGNICATDAGRYPGPFRPVSSPCQAITPWGLAGGVVTQ